MGKASFTRDSVKAQNLLRTSRGFTIVELLIVVVVIAILAAITLVAYNGITTKANTTVMKSDLVQFNKAQEVYREANGSAFGNDTQMKDAGASSLAQKSAWSPASTLNLSGLTTTTPKGKYLLAYRSSVTTVWLEGTLYRDIKNENFQIAYWDYETNQWKVRQTSWYGNGVARYDLDDVYAGFFSNQDGSFPCTEATFEQCVDNPT